FVPVVVRDLTYLQDVITRDPTSGFAPARHYLSDPPTSLIKIVRPLCWQWISPRLILRHFKTRRRVFSNWGRMMGTRGRMDPSLVIYARQRRGRRTMTELWR